MEHIFGQDHKKTAMSMPQMGALPVVTCSKCGGIFFENAFLLRVLSAIVSPDGQEHIIPEPVFRCTSCHSVIGAGNYSEPTEDEDANNIVDDNGEMNDETLSDIEEGDEDKPILKLV